MSRIDGEFVRAIAVVWHGLEPPAAEDCDALARMLAPMDDAGEAFAEQLGFDMEPSDYRLALEAEARPAGRPPGRPTGRR